MAYEFKKTFIKVSTLIYCSCYVTPFPVSLRIYYFALWKLDYMTSAYKT